ncbi:MAG: hypothetical protein P1U56_21625 [Saprospiraceae bacterium]|nr:hypothetical protein [Saprospiraceae bacterium]
MICLYGIVKIIIEIINQRKCPEDEELKDVVLGITKKNTASADKVIRHLGICEKCQERAREIGSE